MTYAANTTVPVGRSRDEIERTLERFGATSTAWIRRDVDKVVVVAFERQGGTYRFTLPIPVLEDHRLSPGGKHGRNRQKRTDVQAEAARVQEERRRFRSLTNYLKAVLDAIDTGIIQADEALLPYRLLPEGDTVYERALLLLAAGQPVDLARALLPGKTP